jgi:dTDP-4-dehydrorhamnose 3,5-epimerase
MGMDPVSSQEHPGESRRVGAAVTLADARGVMPVEHGWEPEEKSGSAGVIGGNAAIAPDQLFSRRSKAFSILPRASPLLHPSRPAAAVAVLGETALAVTARIDYSLPRRVVVDVSPHPKAPPRDRMSSFTLRATSADPAAIADVTYKKLGRHADARGWLVEIYREDELDGDLHPVMAYVSQTQSGVARGPHEHVDQTDYFAFIGPGDFELLLWDAREGSPTFGFHTRTICGASNPAAVTIPPGVVHAYRNTSDGPGWVFNGPNRLYAGPGKKEKVDEIRHECDAKSPFRIAGVVGLRASA